MCASFYQCAQKDTESCPRVLREINATFNDVMCCTRVYFTCCYQAKIRWIVVREGCIVQLVLVVLFFFFFFVGGGSEGVLRGFC